MKVILKKTGGLFFLLMILLTGCHGREAEEQQIAKTEAAGQAIREEAAPVLLAEGIRKISVSEGANELYSISYEPKEHEGTYEYWKMAVPYEDKAIVDTEVMLQLYETLESLDFTAVEADKEHTGLESPNKEIALEFCQAKEGEEAPSAREADSRCVLMIGHLDGQGNYYTALKSNPQTVYRMNQSAIDSLINADPFTLVLKIGAVVPINTVEEVEITTGGKEYILSFDREKYFLSGEEADADAYKSLYTELLSILLEKEIPKVEVKQEKIPDLHMKFVRNIESLPNVTVEYYTYDNTSAVLRIDGTENFLVKQMDVDRLIENIEKQFAKAVIQERE